ncbi:hypothetical protein OG244_23690 [Streptomyces brevispora]|uniref:hypothetical protein n=1 Tax=Streptomyces brevispora TaxID=887462 RepID=UPI002E353CA0|nr:hypothetical protein [Streptomyces brevispora]
MTSLFDRLDEEEALIRGELDALRQQIATAEERLARLTITRDTLRSLAPDAADHNASPSAPKDRPLFSESSRDGDKADRPVGDEPEQHETLHTPLPLETARQRMLALLEKTGQPMQMGDINTGIGEHSSRTETNRSRLKRLVSERMVIEHPVGWFAIVPAARSNPNA